MDLYNNAGGDYHTSYWPQPSFLSSRGYHFEQTFPTYSELRFVPQNGNTKYGHVIYWHYSYDQGTIDLTFPFLFLIFSNIKKK